MLSVVKAYILEEVKKDTYFVAIQADETTDISPHSQPVLVLQYPNIHNNVIFFKSISIQNAAPDRTATRESRLIAQAAIMREATGGEQQKVKDVYRNAHNIHCYAY